MSTAIAAAVSSLTLLAGIAAQAAGAQVAGQDSVTGTGILVVFAGTQLQQTFEVAIDARSGPTGEQPSGTVTFRGSSLPVTCLSVSGHQAYVGATFLLRTCFPIEHRGRLSPLGVPDFLAISPVTAVLTRCPPPPTASRECSAARSGAATSRSSTHRLPRPPSRSARTRPGSRTGSRTKASASPSSSAEPSPPARPPGVSSTPRATRALVSAGSRGRRRARGTRMLSGAELVKPGEERWDSARAAWNLAIDQRPAMVARPGNADEVAAGRQLRLARTACAWPCRPRGTARARWLGRRGHAPAEDGAHDRGRGRRREPPRRGSARPPSGGTSARWPRRRGSPALSGSSAEVGVVGYTLGGGHGWLARKHGLACNSVLAAEVVTADGQLVRADRENEPDLFWALRGGGGNFGVVTALEFELYPVPELYAGHVRLAVGAHGGRPARVARVGLRACPTR